LVERALPSKIIQPRLRGRPGGSGEIGLAHAYDAVDNFLHVVDHSNNRVLVFNVAPGSIANGENASYVLGQTNFTTAAGATTQSGMRLPSGLDYDATYTRLFVGDSSNNRVMVFNVAPGTIANGENAAYVLFPTRTSI
jgi:DNA-binding beta-propeller fold protein YncE